MDLPQVTQEIQAVVTAAREGKANQEQLLQALTALRALREHLSAWEPELIAAARADGTSWVALAPALGVASRQAAERRFLRLQPSPTAETTKEARVDAERDRRAGDRAVAEWARHNSAILRQLASQVSTLTNLAPAAQATADRLTTALGDNDAASLLPPLAAAHPHLTQDHPGLANQLAEITGHTDRLRRTAANNRRDRNS